MAFPKLLQKLFQNNGAGTKLRSEILPDIPYSSITGAPTTDSALSATSTNPVQNKVIKAAIDSVSTSVSSSGYQVGDMKLWAVSNVPAGWFRCDGSTVANMQTNYPKLFAFLGTNVLPNYSVMLKGGTASVSIRSTASDGKSVSVSAPRYSFDFINSYKPDLYPFSENAYINTQSASVTGASGHVDKAIHFAINFSKSEYSNITFSNIVPWYSSWSTDKLSATANLSTMATLYVLIKHD